MSDFENMTVSELKELLKEAGLPVSGKKADLIARLEENSGETTPVEEESAIEESEESEEEEFDEEYEDEDWEDDDDYVDEHIARQKPILSDEIKEALALRAAQKKATPSFRRTEWFRYKRLSRSGWR